MSTMDPSRADFCHPYEPYSIQLDFMKSLYQSIECGKVAIFESPTGTGKSLSLICGALTWLRDNARRQIEGSVDEQNDGADGDWLAAAEREVRKQDFIRELSETESRLNSIRKQEIARQEAMLHARTAKKPVRINHSCHDLVTNHLQRLGDGTACAASVNEDEFLLDEYHSGDDISCSSKNGALSSSTLALLAKLGPVIREEPEVQEDRVKVIFCSRTHSQLTQFVNELRRVIPPSGLPSDTPNDQLEVVKHLPMGSRKNLCINPKVLGLSSTLAINERCLELQKPNTTKEQKCQYLPSKNDTAKVEVFRDRAIATIRDIEDLGKLGQRMDLCPYYASRSAIRSSEVLTLPYPLLLQKSAREALGVTLENNIVVIDEAHNLMDAIADTVSTTLSLSQLDLATKQVISYVQRFKNKLKGLNRMYVTQLIRLLNSFTECVGRALATPTQSECAITAAELMAGKGVDQIKLHKLLQYLAQSKLAHKVEGYVDSQADMTSPTHPRGILMHVQSFLAILMNPNSEGRFFVTRQESDTVVRYTLLDPREHFRDVVEQARAVILAGGTMSPMSDYADYLFSYLNPDRLSTFSFGHVIPRENMIAQVVTRGPTGNGFDFTYEKRNDKAMITELGKMLLSVCRSTPDGVVAFFPSYDYLAKVTDIWKAPAPGTSIMSAISEVKKVFEEVRGASSEDLLRAYSQVIDEGKGAVMLSVVGGKLSEGINFSDKLGRAVVAVGLPFPNLHSAEWKAKIEHIEHLKYQYYHTIDGKSEDQSRNLSRAAGKDFYENACMRAVNQSIGRAIRHKNDYAAILLVDRRFATERIQKKLPHWIQQSMGHHEGSKIWPDIEHSLHKFFDGRQQN